MRRVHNISRFTLTLIVLSHSMQSERSLIVDRVIYSYFRTATTMPPEPLPKK
jgi:hypothetical protein